MNGFLVLPIISAVVLLVCFSIHAVASIIIANRSPENAADIISAMGRSFPIRGLWWRRK